MLGIVLVLLTSHTNGWLLGLCKCDTGKICIMEQFNGLYLAIQLTKHNLWGYNRLVL